MKLTTTASLAISIVSVIATPAALTAPKGHHFVAAGPSDSRSPCPGLNALANHGFLPRDGKNIGVADYVKACQEGLGVGPSFCLPIGIIGLQSNCSHATKMDLQQLGHHDILIEHDGSLAHQDAYFGKDYTVNKRSYDMFTAPFKGHKYTSLKLASATKFGRVNDSLNNNPDVTYGPRELALSYGETALYLQTMGRNVLSGVARVDWIETFFGQERLPYELGWTKGPEVTLETIGAMAAVLQTMGPTPGDEGIYILTAGAYETLIEGKGDLMSVLKPNACS